MITIISNKRVLVIKTIEDFKEFRDITRKPLTEFKHEGNNVYTTYTHNRPNLGNTLEQDRRKIVQSILS